MAYTMITVLFLVLILTGAEGAGTSKTSTRLRLYNACPFPVWPAWFSSTEPGQISGASPTKLNTGKFIDVGAPFGWNGRFWGRTACNFDAYGRGSCETGDCNGKLECQTSGSAPATLAGFSGTSNYDVSVVDGYNLPIKVQPSDTKCKVAGCHSDVNSECPHELAIHNKAGDVVACKSACLAFGDPSSCCTGYFNSAKTCRPTSYSQIFKRSCPQAMTYAHDDTAFSCFAPSSYTITFCPA